MSSQPIRIESETLDALRARSAQTGEPIVRLAQRYIDEGCGSTAIRGSASVTGLPDAGRSSSVAQMSGRWSRPRGRRLSVGMIWLRRCQAGWAPRRRRFEARCATTPNTPGDRPLDHGGRGGGRSARAGARAGTPPSRVRLRSKRDYLVVIAEQLRGRGHDVASVHDDAYQQLEGAPDDEVFAAARADERVVVTENVPDFERRDRRACARRCQRCHRLHVEPSLSARRAGNGRPPRRGPARADD